VSQENVEVVSLWASQLIAAVDAHRGDAQSYAAELQGGEFDAGARAALDLLHPAVIWTSALGEVYEGKPDCARFASQLLAASESYSLSLQDVTDLGTDQVLAEYEVAMTGAASGIEGRFPVCVVFTVCDGRISRMVEYASRHRALKAVGLEE